MAGSLGDLVISIAGDIAKLEMAMGRAELVTARTAEKIDKAMDMANKSILALGASFVGLAALEKFTSKVEGAIAYTASLHTMAQQFATTASELSSYNLLAKQTGVQLSTVGQGMQGLAKSMYETAQGTGKARDVLYGMGMSVKDTNGQLKATSPAMLEFAQKLQGLSNDTERLGAVQKVMRGAGAELLPFLKELAKQGEQTAKVTDDQAEAAHKLEQKWVELGAVKGKVYMIIAQQIVPVLTAATQVMIDLADGTQGLNAQAKKLASENTIRQWAINTVIGVTMVVDGLRYVAVGIQIISDIVGVMATFFVESFKNIGTVIGVSGAMLGEFSNLLQGIGLILSGQFTAGAQVVKQAWAGLSAGVEQMGDRFKESFENIGTAGSEAFSSIEDRMAGFAVGGMTERFLDQLAKMGDGFKETAKQADGASGVITKFKKDAVDAMALSLLKENAALMANLSSLQKYGVEMKDTAVEVAKVQLAEMERNGALADHARRTGESIAATKARILGMAQLKDELSTLVRLEKEYADNVRRVNEANGAAVQKIVDQIQAQKDANATLGATNDQLTAYAINLLKVKIAETSGMEGIEGMTRAWELQIQKLQELQGLQADGNFMRNMVSAAKEAATFFSDMAVQILQGKNAVDVLRDSFKNLGIQLAALAAQKFVLNIIGNILGGQAGAAILNAAGQAGQGSLAGTILSGLSGGSSAYNMMGGTSMLGSMGSGFQMGWTGAAGPQATQMGAYAQQFGAALKAASGPLLIFAAVVAAIAVSTKMYGSGWGQTADSAPNKFTSPLALDSSNGYQIARALGVNDKWASILSLRPIVSRLFGHGAEHADAYGIKGTIGAGGSFDLQNWQDMSRRGGVFSSDQRWQNLSPLSTDQHGVLQSFFASLADITDSFTKTLGLGSGALSGYSKPVDLQLSNNGQYDPAALSNLFGSVLQEQTAMLLKSAGDTKWSDYISGLKETGDALTQTVTEFIATYSGLKALNLKGLDMTALDAWRQSGESLAQTFQRVAQAQMAFDDAFMTEPQKLQAAQKSIADAFNEIHMAVPANNQAFYDLVHSLDLSTEAGRHAWEVMMGVSQAFLSVGAAAQQAAAQATAAAANFNSIAVGLSPGYGNIVNQQGFTSALAAFNDKLVKMGGTAWTQSQAMGNIQAWIANPAQMAGALAYGQSIGAVPELSALLAAFKDASGGASGAAQALGGLSSAATKAAGGLESVKSSRAGIVSWLGGLFLNNKLSPLKPAQQFDYAQAAYVENLMKLKKNPKDKAALADYTKYAQDYLDQALAMYGSGAKYQAIFAAVTGQAAEFGGLVDARGRPTSSADTEASTRAIVDAIKELQRSLGLLSGTIKGEGDKSRSKSSRDADKLAGATRDAATLAYGRTRK